MTQTADTIQRPEKKWRRKLRERAEQVAAETLEPGEQIVNVVQGQARPRFWLGLELLIGAWMFFLIKYYTVALTDRRLILLRGSKLTGRAKRVEWAEPRESVVVDMHKHGLLLDKLFLRRRTQEGMVRLRVARRFRSETDAVADALGAGAAAAA
jgi:hypothetical protein